MKRIQKEWNYGFFNPFPYFIFYFFNKFKCFIICYIIILNLINICFTKCIYFLVKFLRYDCVFYIYSKWLFFMSKYSKRKKIKQRWKYWRYYLTYPFLPPPKKKPQMIWSCKALAILIYVYFIYIVLPWFRNF